MHTLCRALRDVSMKIRVCTAGTYYEAIAEISPMLVCVNRDNCSLLAAFRARHSLLRHCDIGQPTAPSGPPINQSAQYLLPVMAKRYSVVCPYLNVVRTLLGFVQLLWVCTRGTRAIRVLTTFRFTRGHYGSSSSIIFFF